MAVITDRTDAQAARPPRALYDLRTRAELALCDALEALADGLPEIEAARARRISAALRAMRETSAAALLLRRFQMLSPPPCDSSLDEALRLLVVEERADADVAVEIADALEAAADAAAAANAEALGYLLRGFFENRRRHLAWRRQAFLERAQATLPPRDFADLTAPMSEAQPDLRIINLVAAE